MENNKFTKILEALLFSNSEPLSTTVLARIIGQNIKPSTISLLAKQLNQTYQETERSFSIAQTGDQLQMRTLPIYQTWLEKSQPLKPIKISSAALEVLAVIAYRQPTTRADIEFMRGVDASHTLKGLLDKNLIKIAGKAHSPGRPLLYKTSRKFLSLFSLQSLQDLPSLQDLDWSNTSQQPHLPPKIEAQ